MKLSQYPNLTLKEDPSNVTTVSHKLMLRAGMIRQVSAGIFAYMPMFYRTVRKVENIVREEMDKSGAVEIKVPIMQPCELWEESGRLKRYTEIDGIMFAFQGRRGTHLCLAPTAEEVVTDIARNIIKSYKDLPVNFYQIGEKFRDEIRPRFGLMRGIEFTMKDAYSFDKDQEGLDVNYEKMRTAYENIFNRTGLKFRMVEADSGAIGGSGSAEFMVLADTGEDLILTCDSCSYAANVEKATVGNDDKENNSEMKEMEIIDTPNTKTMEELEKLTGVPVDQSIKSVLYLVDSDPVAVFIRGDLDVNEVKLGNELGAELLRPMTDEEVKKYTGADSGSVGAHEISSEIKVVFDQSTEKLVNFMTGANETDKHKKNVNWERDVDRPEKYYDLRTAKAGDKCPHCDGKLTETRGIEVGHIFKLGTKYSEAMGAYFHDEDGKDKPCVMGCYGIGVTRLAQSAVEQSHDENGIIWPEEIAPFRVHLVGLNLDDENIKKKADELYSKLLEMGIEVLYDDRTDKRPGEKFADADLFGMPVRLTVSKRTVDENVIEWKMRTEKEAQKISEEIVMERLN